MSDRREAWARAFFPRTTENALQERGLLRGVLAGVLDAASLPGRGYAAMWNRYNEPVLEGMARTGADPNSPLALRVAEGIARDPLTLLSAPVGGLAGSGGSALASGVGGTLLRRAAPVAADAAANTGLAALAQYGTEGRVNLADLAMGAGVGAGMHGAGGAVSKMSPAARAKILDNPNFRKWFGDSKVVDDAGNPLVVYHGTKSRGGFDAFDPEKIGTATDEGFLGKGFYFTTSESTADAIGGITKGQKVQISPAWSGSAYGEGGSSGAFYVSAKNPLVIKPDGWSWDKRHLVRDHMGIGRDASAEDILGALQRSGNDAVILDYSGGGWPHQEIMIPAPTQIKSATGNRGTFDPNDPNITHFAGGQSPVAGANALAGRYFRGVAGAKAEGEPVVTDQKQYDALPAGAAYKDANGRPHIKGGTK